MNMETRPDDQRFRPPENYNVVVRGLKEVTLAGTADPAFWSEQLRREALYPWVKDDHTELLITATDSKWMSLSFQELTIAVSVCLAERCPQPDGLFLIQAFNSRRFFALVERAFYRTPYDLGEVHLKAVPPFSVSFSERGIDRLRLEMADETPLQDQGHESWEGPIFLPGKSEARPAKRRLFHARLSGLTERCSYQTGTDQLLINPSPRHPVFQELLTSDFAGLEWRVRRDATHARSATYEERKPR